MLATVRAVLDWHQSSELREYNPVSHKERTRLLALFRAALGPRPLSRCKPADLLDFIAAQTGCRSNWTRRRVRATVCKPFNVAAQLGLIAKNPFAGLKLPRGKNGRDWTDAEYAAILRHSPAYLRRLIVFVRFGGARPGEARSLLWSEVREELGACVQDRHKTDWIDEAPRRIHFNGVLLKLLCWLRRHKAHRHHVFVNAFGRPWQLRSLTKLFAAVRRRAGVSAGCKLHGGRHSFATGAILNGVDVATLAELLGHRSILTTQRYLHLAHRKDHLNEAANRAIGR